eukprot:scaffold25180_cov22-Prasinocladus_malaysianus.AAC.1
MLSLLLVPFSFTLRRETERGEVYMLADASVLRIMHVVRMSGAPMIYLRMSGALMIYLQHIIVLDSMVA